MATFVTLSPKYQIVIPKEVRERLKLKPGQKLHVFVLNGVLQIAVPKPVSEIFGMVKGLRWEEGDRDRNDRY